MSSGLPLRVTDARSPDPSSRGLKNKENKKKRCARQVTSEMNRQGGNGALPLASSSFVCKLFSRVTFGFSLPSTLATRLLLTISFYYAVLFFPLRPWAHFCILGPLVSRGICLLLPFTPHFFSSFRVSSLPDMYIHHSHFLLCSLFHAYFGLLSLLRIRFSMCGNVSAVEDETDAAHAAPYRLQKPIYKQRSHPSRTTEHDRLSCHERKEVRCYPDRPVHLGTLI